MEYKDYYKIMGVERDASKEEIKRAYRKLARKYHPDVSKESGAEAKFKELGEAYEVLKDPEKRAAYDQLGTQWRAGQEFHPPPGWDSDSAISSNPYTGTAAATHVHPGAPGNSACGAKITTPGSWWTWKTATAAPRGQ